MTNLTCLICRRAMEHPAMACQPCENRLDACLVEIGHLHAELPDHLERGQANGQRVSGSREAPLPLRVDPLDLSMPARAHTPTQEARKHPEDWLGHTSVLTLLDSWVRDWRDTRDMGERLPVPAGASLVSWLRVRLEWACGYHTAVGEFDREMRELRAALRLAAGVSDIKPVILDVPCRKCEWRSLTQLPGQDRVECGHCGDLSTGDEYQRWIGLLVAGIQDGAVAIDSDALLLGEEAATLAKVKADLIRQWASRGALPVTHRTERGRPLYRAGDVANAARGTVAKKVDHLSH